MLGMKTADLKMCFWKETWQIVTVILMQSLMSVNDFLIERRRGRKKMAIN